MYTFCCKYVLLSFVSLYIQYIGFIFTCMFWVDTSSAMYSKLLYIEIVFMSVSDVLLQFGRSFWCTVKQLKKKLIKIVTIEYIVQVFIFKWLFTNLFLWYSQMAILFYGKGLFSFQWLLINIKNFYMNSTKIV